MWHGVYQWQFAMNSRVDPVQRKRTGRKGLPRARRKRTGRKGLPRARRKRTVWKELPRVRRKRRSFTRRGRTARSRTATGCGVRGADRFLCGGSPPCDSAAELHTDLSDRMGRAHRGGLCGDRNRRHDDPEPVTHPQLKGLHPGGADGCDDRHRAGPADPPRGDRQYGKGRGVSGGVRGDGGGMVQSGESADRGGGVPEGRPVLPPALLAGVRRRSPRASEGF